MDLYRCLKSFKTIVDNKSMTAAAKRQFRPKSQLSKELTWLEDMLESQLLIRTTRKLTLTESGAEVYEYATQALDDFQQLKNQLHSDQVQLSGKLSVTAPIAFTESRLTEAFNKFMLAYPQIKLEVNFTNSHIDLIGERIDIGVRTANTQELQNNSYDYQFLLESQRKIFVSPECIAQFGKPKHPHDLEKYPCLTHSDLDNPRRWIFKDDLSVIVQQRYACNNVKSLIDAAAAGLGVVYLSSHHYQIQPHLQNNMLAPILEEHMPSPKSIYFCIPKQAYTPKKISLFIKFIRQHVL